MVNCRGATLVVEVGGTIDFVSSQINTPNSLPGRSEASTW